MSKERFHLSHKLRIKIMQIENPPSHVINIERNP